MSNPSSKSPSEQPLDLVVCPDCGASVVVGEKLCWLCSRKMDGQGQGASRGRRASGPLPADAARRGAAGDVTFTVLMGLTVVALGLVCIGAGMDEPGVAIGIAIVAAPALLAVLVGWLRARAKGAPLGPIEVIARFALSFAVLLGSLAALTVAACIAMFFFCIYLISQS